MDLHRVLTICAVIIFAVTAGYATIVHFNLVLKRKKGESLDYWDMIPALKKEDPALARRWTGAQIIALIAGLYLIIFR